MEKKHFWYTERSHVIAQLLSRMIPKRKGKTFLEIGCGTGILLPIIESLGFRVTGMDINFEALKYARMKSHASLIRSSLFTYKKKQTFDVIGMFDVFEHQTDDQKFLSLCNRLLKPNGYVCMSVPSHMWLWSQIDTLSGHVRRYELTDLKNKLNKEGFTVIFSNHWNVFLFPLYVVWRIQFFLVHKKFSMKRYLQAPYPPINELCKYILHKECSLFFSISFPFGSSLFVVARKNR